MVQPEILNIIEKSSLSTWLRESQSLFGFYFILTIHTLGLSLLVGPNAAIDLRLLGIVREIPLQPLRNWFKVMWVGFAINATSGIFLLLAYPTKAITNFEFYIKLSLIGLAVWVMTRIKKEVFDDPSLSEAAMEIRGKSLAMWSLILWAGAITAGRLLAYTYTYIMYGRYAPGG